MKGQLFTLDVLAALFIVTIIIGYTVFAFEQVYNRSPEIEYDKIQAMADDWSQIAVKNILVNEPNNITDLSTWSLLEQNMSVIIPDPYEYNVTLGTKSFTKGSQCVGKSNVAVSRRIVYDIGEVYGTGKVKVLTVEVCV